MRSIWDYFEKQQTFYIYKVVLSDCGALRGRGRVHAVPRESSSSKCPLNENLESSSFSSSSITQRLEPLNPGPPETNWKLVEHKIDDSQTLGCKSVSVRRGDGMCSTNRTPHWKDSPLAADKDSEAKNTCQGELAVYSITKHGMFPWPGGPTAPDRGKGKQ